jgi:hypothetical protein
MQETNNQLIDHTLKVWQPRTSELLTREDGRQISENVTGFFKILLEWEVAERMAASQNTKTETKAECDQPGICTE